MLEQELQLRTLIQNGEAQGVATFFENRTKNERERFRKIALKQWGRARPGYDFNQRIENIPSHLTMAKQTPEEYEVLIAAGVACLSIGPMKISRVTAFANSRYVRLYLEARFNDKHELVGMFEERYSDWLQSWAKATIEDEDQAINWREVFLLSEFGAIELSKTENYYRYFASMPWYQRYTMQEGTTVVGVDYLWQSKSSLVEDVWKLFEYEEIVTSWDRPKGEPRDKDRWPAVLARLANDGLILRGKVVDSALQAMLKDFKEFQLLFYLDILEAIEPTPDEIAARQEQYVALFNSPANKCVTYALKTLKALHKSGQLDTAATLDALPTALRHEPKSLLTQALSLLSAIAAKDKSMHPRAAVIACAALEHDKPDVQEKAFKLIAKFGQPKDAELSEQLKEAHELACPSVKNAITEWLGEYATNQTTEESSEVDTSELLARAKKLPARFAKLTGVDASMASLNDKPAPAVRINRMQIPALDPSKKFQPIETLEELIEEATAITAGPTDYMQFERVLDGLARLGNQRPDNFEDLSGQLLKTIRTNRNDVSAEVQLFEELLEYWITLDEIELSLENETTTGFLRGRISGLVSRLKNRKSCVLLSTPTHGTWLDPITFVYRVQRLQVENGHIDEVDFVQAMLRLAPDNRLAALELANKIPNEFRGITMYALGGNIQPADELPDLWAAASRARLPFEIDDALKDVIGYNIAGVTEPGEYSYSVASTLSPPYSKFLDIMVDNSRSKGHSNRYTTAKEIMGTRSLWNVSDWTFRARAARWPVNDDRCLAAGANIVGRNVDWHEAQWANRALFEPLLDPDCDMSEMGTLLLALGLGCKEKGEAGLATDILISAIEDGRIDGLALGKTLGELTRDGLLKPTRLNATLSEAARISPLHAHVVRLTLEHALAEIEESKLVRNLHALAEPLLQLCIEAGQAITNPATQEYLGKISGSSKLAKAAKKLLALKPDPKNQQSKQAAAIALEGRIARAERWAAWDKGEAYES